MKTKRLLFRTFSERDARNLYLLNLDKEVIQYTGDESFENIAEALKFIKTYDHYKKFGMGRWIIETKDNFIGWCGLKRHENGDVDIGFRILKEFWCKGYGKEAGVACLKFGFKELNLNKIIARTSIGNIKVQNLLQIIGMNIEGHSHDETMGPVIKYCITKDQFKLLEL